MAPELLTGYTSKNHGNKEYIEWDTLRKNATGQSIYIGEYESVEIQHDGVFAAASMAINGTFDVFGRPSYVVAADDTGAAMSAILSPAIAKFKNAFAYIQPVVTGGGQTNTKIHSKIVGTKRSDDSVADKYNPKNISNVNTDRMLGWYRNVFDTVMAANLATFDALALTNANGGSRANYYNMSYVLDATISMYEATKDETLLEQALSWCEDMVADTTVVDTLGHSNWTGNWSSNGRTSPDANISHFLDEVQGSTMMARLARIILTDTTGELADFTVRAQAVMDNVKARLITKELEAWGQEAWLDSQIADTTEQLTDKLSLMMTCLVDIWKTDKDATAKRLLDKWIPALHARDVIVRNKYIKWDIGLTLGGSPSIGPDTSHANRRPYLQLELNDSGLTDDNRSQLHANSFLDIIYDTTNPDNPRFRNYINGNNSFFSSNGPYVNGIIYSGYAHLGRVDKRVNVIMHKVLQIMTSGGSSDSAQFNEVNFGQIELAGQLAKNLFYDG